MKHIRYKEGQWFAIPLLNGGYAIGIIARGSYKTKGGLGYFFGPKYTELPNSEETFQKRPEEAILIGQFGDLGIIRGEWPIIQSTRPFIREEWPIPKFGKTHPLFPSKGYIREYHQDDKGDLELIQNILVDVEQLVGLPIDGIMGSGLVEIQLTKILDNLQALMPR